MAVLALATTLLVSACGSPSGSGPASAGQPTASTAVSGQPSAASSTPTATTKKYQAKDGVVDNDRMAQIYVAAQSLANKSYDNAAEAGVYAFDSTGAMTQNPQKLALIRDKHASVWDEVKTALDTPGCVLTADHKNSSGVLIIPISCSGAAKPSLSIHAQYDGRRLAYFDAVHGDGTEN